MTKENNENLVDEKDNLPDEQLTDLQVLDEQAEQAKGGPLNFTKIEYKDVPYNDRLWGIFRSPRSGGSVKPGVERSGTPGTVVAIISKPAERPTVESLTMDDLLVATAIARLRGLWKPFGLTILGFRCASLHALR